ncbi:MAG: hypothetical protein JJLCMIEE_02291 [Acidimicrobiales bacterium]|nr:MAG: DAK2 domain-containing protein [Actinomycetota bacterium]MBV6509223.1 hypothetical protein [Acidimicrobiales bacterium]RIK08435.1 MAG: hypothetical protein DCC48_00340 [Acidobacteriota bacterium]
MAEIDALLPEDVYEVLVSYRDVLRSYADGINELNVFPVPDADTGTNMAATMDVVVDALEGEAEDFSRLSAALKRGALQGARGNSGVILSQAFIGLADVVGELGQIDSGQLAAALLAASKEADTAMAEPVEGTMITVIRDAALGASRATENGADLGQVLRAASDAGLESLDRTPDLLPVLREHGVVDAGGAGYVLLLDVMTSHVTGRPLDEIAAPERVIASEPEHGTFGHRGPRYEVMFLLQADPDGVEKLRKRWRDLGDSIAIAGGSDGLWSCHIHTGDVGAAIEACIDLGSPRQISVTDLARQVREAVLDE